MRRVPTQIFDTFLGPNKGRLQMKILQHWHLIFPNSVVSNDRKILVFYENIESDNSFESRVEVFCFPCKKRLLGR